MTKLTPFPKRVISPATLISYVQTVTEFIVQWHHHVDGMVVTISSLFYSFRMQMALCRSYMAVNWWNAHRDILLYGEPLQLQSQAATF